MVFVRDSVEPRSWQPAFAVLAQEDRLRNLWPSAAVGDHDPYEFAGADGLNSNWSAGHLRRASLCKLVDCDDCDTGACRPCTRGILLFAFAPGSNRAPPA